MSIHESEFKIVNSMFIINIFFWYLINVIYSNEVPLNLEMANNNDNNNNNNNNVYIIRGL
ncbi:hypothetical protein DERP_012568 [Dermatophagoides pteronyssinus]|uniref:Uncharacterized protein n=1 Tax=Dermatophagoides pteronyssinus TaxID=6956 RepID=A0ABQ8IUU6_DERPT|nr:hypothetical protein DERP_012568 [Dermatophagoides pteronyssinus]